MFPSIDPAKISTDSSFSDRDRNFYHALIILTAYHYWQKFKHLDLWRTPYSVQIDVGNGEGLGDVDSVIVKLPKNPHFWNVAACANTVGHEFAHMLYARLLHIEKPLYGWGGGNREPVNAIHYADGLNQFERNPQYIESHWKLNAKKLRIMRIAVFDIEGLMRDREQVDKHVQDHKQDPRWKYF